MIPIQECFSKICAVFVVSETIFCPPQTLFPYRSVEAFDICLFIFLVGTGNAVAIAIVPDMDFECLFKLRTAIGLEELDVTVKPSLHALFEKEISLFCG